MSIASFGAGCFWGVEYIFRNIPGVQECLSGYMGGEFKNPRYEDICTGQTGHAEVVQIKFDPSLVSYDELLSYFWRIHDPTQLNRQGVDTGSQYRSAIFYHSQEQKELALKSMKDFNDSGVFDKDAVTEITEASMFFAAEEYHQAYYLKKFELGYTGPVCHILREK